MGWTLTLALTAGCTLIVLFCGWRDSRAPDLAKGPRMAPYRPIMLLALVVLVMLIVHIANLLGVHTGNNQITP